MKPMTTASLDTSKGRTSLDELRSFLVLGVSLLVGTRDALMRPALVRCGGARLGADGLLRIAIPIPEGESTLANIDATGVIALTAARPTSYRTLQVKGRDAARAEWKELGAVTRAHRSALVAEVVEVGLDGDQSGRSWSNRFVALSFTPQEIFDQTPGPTAGLSMLLC